MYHGGKLAPSEAAVEAEEIVARTRKLIRMQEALVNDLTGEAKWEGENVLSMLRDALKDFIKYRQDLNGAVSSWC